jgi:hypothetical protein
MLGVGLGCGALLLVGLVGAAGVAYSYWQRNSALVAQLAAAEAAAAAARAGQAAATAEPVGDCKKAYDCCLAITAKAANAQVGVQCEAFKAAGRAESDCTTALDGYRNVAKTHNLICD